MEAEEPYDSLEDDCASISGGSISSSRLIPKLITLDAPDISNYLPLYGGEVSREVVKSRSNVQKKIKSKIPLLPSRTNISKLSCSVKDAKETNVTTNKTKSYSSFHTVNSLDNILGMRLKKSYLEMFHEKMGYKWKKANLDQIPDTRRATCNGDTFRTARSSPSSSDFTDAASFVSDTSSFYYKYIEEDKAVKNTKSLDLISKLSLVSLSDSNNKSVSEYSIRSSDVKCNKKVKKSTSTFQSKSKPSVTEINALGTLGPDRDSIKEKLVNLKKQQSYGQRMSNRNRIKMLELKVVKDFKIEMKKSSELNKSSYNVLNG